jgi:aspartyl-tRNA synthetase
MRTYSIDTVKQVGQQTQVNGWVNSRRDHGGLVFVDLRDHTGVVQITIQPDHAEAFAVAEQLRDEFVIAVTGMVKEREDSLKNPNLPTGSVELFAETITILNKSDTPPIQVNSTQVVNEDFRLKYRYLDLRRPKMQTMLAKRAELYKNMRSYMEEREFTEVTTPIIANSSPEGARDFLIPSRIHAGKFYALPQAPQQFKQLLMVGGVHRYYQLAACFRDEDPRADRLYGEFYQLDVEMSFVQDGEEVRTTMEPLIKQLVTDFAGKKLLANDIPRIAYDEAMDAYGSDKPDLRYGMKLISLVDELKDCGFGVFTNALKDGGVVKAICVTGGASLSRSQIDTFTDLAKKEGAGGMPYMTVVDGKATSSIAKFFNEAELAAIVTKTDAKEGDLIIFGADKRVVVNKVLGALRIAMANHLKLKDSNVIALCWIIDFPFYEWDDKAKKLDFGHNPFSMPKGGLESLQAQDKLTILADQYDMVMNGYEICSGGVRNHNPDTLYKVFEVLGYDKDYVEAKFGIDRMFMELMGEDNVREVVAFPKNGSGVDVMMNSPSTVDDIQLKELNIKLVDPK